MSSIEDKWEFEGPVELFKQWAKAKVIPRDERRVTFGSEAAHTSAPSQTSPDSVAITDGSTEFLTKSAAAASSEQVLISRTTSSSSSLPPLPPGPSPASAGVVQCPPLPPGPPPSSAVVVRCPPLPPGPPPASAGCPPLPQGQPPLPPGVPPKQPTASFNIGSSSMMTMNVQDRRRRRPRGMSLSSGTCRTLDAYELMNQVGMGMYGSVFKARDRETGEIVALKKVDLSGEKEGFPVTALREIKFLSIADHDNIVKLREVVSSKGTEHNRNRGTVYMVFDYAEYDLTGVMKTTKLAEIHCMCLMKQLLNGLYFAHAHNVLHRDIKPSNILVNREGILKVADWGLCRKHTQGGKYTNRVVTLWYRAPELLLGETQYSKAIDMWAVGCLMGELLTGRAILPGKDEPEQLKLILEMCGKPKSGSWPSGWESLPYAELLKNADEFEGQMQMRFAALQPAARDLLFQMLTLDPAKRISAHDALSHDFFWGDIEPCHPEQIPLPRGDGMHEYQLKEEARKIHERKQQQLQPPPDIRSHHKRGRIQSPARSSFH